METLIIIKSKSELQQLKDYIKASDYLAFDTETNGVTKEARIIGFSISASVDLAYYVVLSYWDKEKKQLVDLDTNDEAKEVISLLLNKNIIAHNAVFDCARVRDNYNIDLMPHVHTDTMVLAHLLDENRHNGLKELSVAIFGEDSKEEQIAMKASVQANGGLLTKDHYELYKADADLMAKYGAKDAILTVKLFYHLMEELYAQNLQDFFFEESMPLVRGPTYDLNTTGLRVDTEKLQKLKGTLEAECLEAKAFIYAEIDKHIKDKYPGTSKPKTFNISSSKQLAWLLFEKLKEPFGTLTKEGKEVCKALGMKLPYNDAAKRAFITTCKEAKGTVYQQPVFNPKTKKMGRPKKVGDVWNYLAADKGIMGRYAPKYKWVKRYLEYTKNMKLLTTYVEGIQERLLHSTINPSFIQIGTTSGRYSSKQPNFQNLPRDDKRIKSCIVARPGKVFVGADYSQLEPRVFASFSKDERLLASFKSGDDFYSVIAAELFDIYDSSASMIKSDDDPTCFANKYKAQRNVAKTVALAAAYGTTAPKMASIMDKRMDEAQEIIDDYFEKFPSVKTLMLESHGMAMDTGMVRNLFGRPRRIPVALNFRSIYKGTPHKDLPYEVRNILNLSINHRIQSTGASIVNRACIRYLELCKELGIKAPIVLQVHDQVVVEAKEEEAEMVASILQEALENTTVLPGVDLVAVPSISKHLAGQK